MTHQHKMNIFEDKIMATTMTASTGTMTKTKTISRTTLIKYQIMIMITIVWKELKLFDDKGYQVAKDELEANLLGRGCIDMLSWKDLTWDVRKRALGYLMYLKRKRSEKMNGRGCADSRPQRDYITKEKSSSPTVSLYALIGLCVMDTLVDRKIITVDIPGAFLQGD